MSLIDRLFRRPTNSPGYSRNPAATPEASADEQAIERYRYFLRTAPPDALEQAHAEAFETLTPEQRKLVLGGLSHVLPLQEQTGRDDPRSLAQMATRAELRQPGTLESTFGRTRGNASGLGTFLAFDLVSTIAAVVIGTAIADAIFDTAGEDGSSEGDRDVDESTSGHDASATDNSGDDHGYNLAGEGYVDFGGDDGYYLAGDGYDDFGRDF